MKIHVVMPGDSVWSIARNYGISAARITEINGLNAQPHLVLGQALVIPSTMTAHRLMPGESIWTLARRYGVSVNSILELNHLTSTSMVYPGMVIRIPENSKNYGTIEVNAFIQPSTPEHETTVIQEAGPYLTYLTAFSHHVTADGSLLPLPDDTILSLGRQFKDALMLSVTNLNESNFDTQLIDKILKSNELQTTVINNILALLRQKDYRGTIIDFERIPPEDRELYNNFLRKAARALHNEGYLIATALAPKTSDIKTGSWHGAHDYKAHGEIVDFVVIMTYEWGWSGGPPMAVAPLNDVRQVINYAVSVIPHIKIMMGMPFYGYDWTLPYTPKSEFAESLGLQEAVIRAGQHGAAIRFDAKSQSPYYNYIDAATKAHHVVWFEDARSYMAKYKLASEYGLRGVSYWALGKPFPQNWYLVNNMFKIEKLV